MSISGISRLQSTQHAASLENKNGNQDDVENAVKDHKDRTQQAYKTHLAEIEKAKEARETKSIWTLIGAIFLGPLIGTAIGGAIGDAANEGDEDLSRELKKQHGVLDLEVDKSFDRFNEAKNELDDSNDQARQTEKFSRELRDYKWTGTT